MNRERGSGSVLMAAVVGMALLLSAVTAGVGENHAAHRRAQSTADLAALAGAHSLLTQPNRACKTARELAEKNGATVTACEKHRTSLCVTVSVATRYRIGNVTAHARAGLNAAAEGEKHCPR